MKDKDIDDLLKYIYGNENQIFPYILNIEDEVNKDKNILEYYKEIIEFEYLEFDLDLLNKKELDENHIIYFLTSKSREIIRNGGWLKYIELKNEKENRIIRKEIAELKIAEFQSRNPKLPYYISISGVIISFISLVISCNPENKPSQDKLYIKEYIMKDTIYETYLKIDTIYKKP